MTDRPEYLDLIYHSYREWKHSYRVTNQRAERELYAREVARLGLPFKARLLEIGFGEGHFLDWARDQGFQIEGVEISAGYVESARGRGHQVCQGTLQGLSQATEPRYQAVVCFDVLEHLNIEEIMDFFHSLKPLLSEEGVILARFPNGASPFGRIYQYGDATHRTILTAQKVDQLAFMTGFRVSASFNAARVLSTARFLGIPARMKYLLAIIIEWLLGQLYFGARYPLDPNIVVHIRHREGPASK